jgi:phosphatidylethanolamine/phosphatidyl-N-methylethanolamine N-methyltransferase
MIRSNESAHMSPWVQWMTFFRQWMRDPLRTASIVPSGRQLARLMADALPHDCRRVVELGGGTGVITREVLRRGIEPQRLLVFELNVALHDLLIRRFPDVHVSCADARAMHEVMQRIGFAQAFSVDAIVSSLGLLSMSVAVQREILTEAFDVLSPGGRLIQFTYGPFGPVSRALCNELGLHGQRICVAWKNIPPASVYVYQRVQA